ncbi:hypothetical protein [Sphingobacterium paramultivorum]|uniref:hypothetical protein n=1 Tax=Sphingobacterium paramultivorum TaxID=2886510 RepID=UPI00192E294A|nr:hypothetical protein [Sphingobacterium paramultivorum]WSO15164.1 hypothetical protein VUL84_01280 [Sphingobacterium paramultivorum]
MRVIILCCFALLGYINSYAQSKAIKKVPTVFVDREGVMRWSDSKAEASFYGVNYTVPFAHAFRALHNKGFDRKQAIDRDVYHFARLGYNAYRIHIWDVEISDKNGNLINNEHLDLLDYLLFKLQERGIRILITGMTNFGNGYPERNINTDAFTYHYDKCAVHANPQAIAAQEKYITQLLHHVNPYTGNAYQTDPYIIGFEINNEPCHTGAIQTTSDYIGRMVKAMKKSGNKKPIFYNVSHNMEHVKAYFDADIQGTTYQWYPVGLVAGRERQGNFLPYIDQYDIPFSNLKGFSNKAKAVYEYDPADNLYSYMHPAMSRTFRSAGFQWITQFAYDPMDIAAYNTEYQTHYLNLAYTPAKALSTMIAAEVAYTIPRNKKFEQYPQDTLFGDFSVSYEQDLSVMNAQDKYFYTNNTTVSPLNPVKLQHIAGHGSSPVVEYGGSGAYFLDRLEDGLWRLEVMPDAEKIADPFAKPSLDREVVHILYRSQIIDIRIPDLGDLFTVRSLLGKNNSDEDISVAKTSFSVEPGVYLLKRKNLQLKNSWLASSPWKNGYLGEYYAPKTEALKQPLLIHEQPEVLEKGRSTKLQFRYVFEKQPDSIILQTDQVSFWKDHNPHIKLFSKDNRTYEADIPASLLVGSELKYTATVFVGGEKITYPDNQTGAPLEWNYRVNSYWTVGLYEQRASIGLFESLSKVSSLETFAIPETAYMTAQREHHDLNKVPFWTYTFHAKDSGVQYFWVKDIKSTIAERPAGIVAATKLCILLKHEGGNPLLNAGFVTKKGYTYVENIAIGASGETLVRMDLADLKLVPTALLPAPYPVFLERFFKPTVPVQFDKRDIEKLIVSGEKMEGVALSIAAIWLE